MARTELTVQTTSRDGVNGTDNGQAVAAANDAMFVNDGATKLYISNASGSTVNIVFETPATVLTEALAIADKTATLATAKWAIFGPFPSSYFNNPTGADAGKVYVDVDQSVTCLAFKDGPAS
jgi:hypothetical protein